MNKLLIFLVLGFIGMVASAPFAFYSLTLAVPNSVAVFAGDSSGQISFVTHVPTGDNGIPSSVNNGGIGSQHAIIVKDNYLFAVNPSSNSLSMFVINPSNPTSLKLINTQPTNFDWPNTVAAHPFMDVVCVATSGENNGIRCFSYSPSGLMVMDNSDRAFGLNLTTPPIIHTGPAQISFSPDGSGIVISIKTASPHTFFYYSFSTSGLSDEPVLSAPMGNVPYGFAFDTDGTVVLTDAAPTGTFSGLQLVYFNTSVDFLLPSYFLIEGQAASCWIERSPSNGNFYIVNAASSSVTEVSRSDMMLSVLGNYATGNGTNPTDITIVQMNAGSTFAYVQTGNTVVVFDISTSGDAVMIQSVYQQSIGAYSAGAAAYVAVGSMKLVKQ